MSITEWYPHTIHRKNRKWDDCEFIQFLAVDPGIVNFCLRIERRYKDGRIIPIVFLKTAFKKSSIYSAMFKKLDEFKEFYEDTHIVMIEKQPPRSIAINRVMQHALTYFMVKMQDMPLLPKILEISAKVKGNELGCPRGENLKKWASTHARDLLEMREDCYSTSVMNFWKKGKDIPKGQKKDDDLGDTVCMIEAYCKREGYLLTKRVEKKPVKFNVL